ncbi:MAG: DEAD/DEAH box helicase [Candidatus Marinimicrobia bacterium]|nr:DEAD/DEAH box helicase [Candidatus Neomarinimicrobiota bacterium]
MNSFTDMGLQSGILDAIQELGFETPTPIQAKTIPHLLSSNKDLIAFAQTGTGKTAAFGLPAIQMTNIEDKRTQTLILCPTRELCMQITRDLTNYSKHTRGIGIVAVYGGASIDTQVRALKREAQIVVGTPGRVKDLINRKRLLLGNVKRVVLDEADEMLTMGFKDDLDEILSTTAEEKQTLLFSATMSNEIVNITKTYMNDPVKISAAQKNTGAENVNHVFYMVHASDRYEVLKRIADINPDIYGIVFCRTRRETKEIANKLMHDGYNADALHGDLSQAQRDEVMGRFRKRHLQILVATDVAARGLDVTDLTHIINYNLPDSAEIYIHRSGRTGRAGKSGTCITIIHTREMGKIKEIERRFQIKFAREQVPSGKDICTKQLYKLIDKIEKVKVDESQIAPFLPAIYEKLDWLSREELIKHFVSAEFNRFLDYYKNAADINVSGRQSRDSRDKRDNRGDRGRQGSRDRGARGSRSRDERRRTPFSRLYINVGDKQNLNPARLMGLINESLNSGSAEIGKIEILKKFSFFEIDEKVEATLIKALKGKDFEGVPLSVEVSSEKPAGASSSKRRDFGKKRDGFRGNRDKNKGGGDRRDR